MTSTVRLLLKLLGISIATIFGLLLIVPCFGFGWHVFHRKYISFAGWTIPVPVDYYVTEGESGPAIWKLSLGRPFFDTPYSHVSFFSGGSGTHVFRGGRDLGPFEGAMSETAMKEGFQLKSKHIVALGDKVASCLEFERTGKQPRSLVRCAAEDANLYPFFEGDARYIPELFAILKGMSQESSRQNADGKKKI